MNACNQKTNRDPVTAYKEREVIAAMMELRLHKLCRSVASGRVDKHRHILDETFDLDEHQLAALAIMLLRGPQTPGEIRARTERYVQFSSVDAVAQVLSDLASMPAPLVVDLGRAPGQSQNRFTHLLGGPVDADSLPPVATASHRPGSPRADRVADLEQVVADLVARVARLESELGLTDAVTARPEEPAVD